MLDLNARERAGLAGASVEMAARVESDGDAEAAESARPETSAALRMALERAGVQSIDKNGAGAGVRRKKAARKARNRAAE